MTTNIVTTNQNIEVNVDAALLENWKAFLDVGSNTIRAYKGAVKRLLQWLQKHCISKPTRTDLIDYKKEMLQDLKPASVQLNIIAIRLFFAWAAQAGLYPNIADNLKGVKVDTSEHRKDDLSSDSIKAILQTINPDTAAKKRDYALFLLLAACGLRSIEAERANIEDLSFIGNKTVLYLQGKGRHDKGDFVIVPSKVEKALREYLATRKSPKATAPLFVSVSNRTAAMDGRLTTRSIRRIIKGYMVEAGYNSDKITTHSLRHSAVTIALSEGKPIDEVMRFARHRSINTTMIYNHRIAKINNSCSDSVAAAII